MDLIKNFGLGTATTINKMEEMPYEGKPLSSSAPATDKQGMKIEGDSGARPNMSQDIQE